MCALEEKTAYHDVYFIRNIESRIKTHAQKLMARATEMQCEWISEIRRQNETKANENHCE